MRTEDRLLTPDEVCDRLQIKKSLLYRLTSEGKIPFIKLGNLLRFSTSDLDRWVSTLASRTRAR